jgi:tetratricopeptide (TPR) repeat protein
VSVLGIALCNGGEALLRLGRLDEATERFERALAHEHRTGSRRLAYPLTGLGDLHRVRDQPSLARARYEEAVRICGAEGDRQGLLPALTGLAGTLAGTDPQAAAEYARWAHREAAGPAVVAALLALGWVADAAGERDRAAGLAAEAAAQARLHRDRANLAGALELAARNETSPDAAR